ncbi:MAG TPA: cyclic nucleotide-binding domain-containing protein, partial [Kofleriaceae bacterium]
MTKAAKTTAGGWQAFTDGGSAPRWVIAARVVMVLAFVATIPTILGVEHGNRLIWTVCIAALPFFWMAFGYHLWRRICPLAVMGQLGRYFGKPGNRKMGDWMAKNYLLVQLAIMVACLTLRLVATNGSDVWLAGFFGAVIALAIATSFLYAGKTWCNFMCPVGLVEKIYTEPARSASEVTALTSQCSPCVACKRHCPDIDLEQGYWKELTADQARPRTIAYFSWPGIVVGFYVYYYLVSGTWRYYFSGAWTYERSLPEQMLAPGFTFAPAIPRVVAAPLTLVAFGAASYAVLSIVERVIRARRTRTLDGEARTSATQRVHHGMLAFAGLVAFNAFYAFAGQPSLQKLPGIVVSIWGVVVVFASTAMFVRRLARREDAYVQEKFAQKILKKWEWGDAPPSDDLKDIYLLHTERTKQREARLRAYKETVREMVADGLVTRNEMVLLDSLRAQLGISDKDHQKIIGELSAEERQLFDPAYQGSVEQRVARERYRADLERLVMEAARQGSAPAKTTLAQLATERGISEAESAQALADLLAPGGPIATLYRNELALIADLASAAEAANTADGDGSSESASLALLRHLAIRRAHDRAVHALGVLSVITKRPELEHVLHAAKQRGTIRPAQLGPLDNIGLVAPLAELLVRIDRSDRAPLADAAILAILGDPSRHLRAAAAVLLTRFDTDKAREALRALLDDPEAIVREAAVRAMGAKSRLTRDVLSKVLDDVDAGVRQAAVRAVSGGTSSNAELPAIDPAMLAQTTKGIGKPGVYATLDANAAMASLTRIEKMMLIRQVPIFAQLDADDLEELASIVEERRIEAGRDLFRQGEVGDAVYLVVKGRVRVFVSADSGETTLAELGPGACIGEMAVLDASPRSASVRALERTRSLRVPGEGFKRLMSERPEMSEAIVAELVRRMRGLVAQHAGP